MLFAVWSFRLLQRSLNILKLPLLYNFVTSELFGSRKSSISSASFLESRYSYNILVVNQNWSSNYNIIFPETSWIIDGLDKQLKYVFRISARNAYGWSNTSEESNEFDLNDAARIAEKQNPIKLILIATGVPISLCICVVVVLSYGRFNVIPELFSISVFFRYLVSLTLYLFFVTKMNRYRKWHLI